jgi:hypothetical protein
MTIKPTLEQLECRLTPANVAPPLSLRAEARAILWQGAQPSIDWTSDGSEGNLTHAVAAQVPALLVKDQADQQDADAAAAKALAALDKAPIDPGTYLERLRSAVSDQLYNLRLMRGQAKIAAGQAEIAWTQADRSPDATALQKVTARAAAEAADARVVVLTRDIRALKRTLDIPSPQFGQAVSVLVQNLEAQTASLTLQSAASDLAFVAADQAGFEDTADMWYIIARINRAAVFQARSDLSALTQAIPQIQ